MPQKVKIQLDNMGHIVHSKPIIKTAKTLSIYSFMKLFFNEKKAVKFFENQSTGG